MDEKALEIAATALRNLKHRRPTFNEQASVAIEAYQAALPSDYAKLVAEARDKQRRGLVPAYFVDDKDREIAVLIKNLADTIEALVAENEMRYRAAVDMAKGKMTESERVEAAKARVKELSQWLEKAIRVIDSAEVKGVMTIAHIHGMPYSGPIFDVDGARAALKQSNEAQN